MNNSHELIKQLKKHRKKSKNSKKQIKASIEYTTMLYEQEEKDIDRAIETLKRIRKK